MFWTSGVATIITASLGIEVKLLSILVLCKKVMSSMFHNLLLFLCMSDLVFLLSSLAMSPVALRYYNLNPSYQNIGGNKFSASGVSSSGSKAKDGEKKKREIERKLVITMASYAL